MAVNNHFRHNPAQNQLLSQRSAPPPPQVTAVSASDKKELSLQVANQVRENLMTYKDSEEGKKRNLEARDERNTAKMYNSSASVTKDGRRNGIIPAQLYEVCGRKYAAANLDENITWWQSGVSGSDQASIAQLIYLAKNKSSIVVELSDDSNLTSLTKSSRHAKEYKSEAHNVVLTSEIQKLKKFHTHTYSLEVSLNYPNISISRKQPGYKREVKGIDIAVLTVKDSTISSNQIGISYAATAMAKLREIDPSTKFTISGSPIEAALLNTIVKLYPTYKTPSPSSIDQTKLSEDIVSLLTESLVATGCDQELMKSIPIICDFIVNYFLSDKVKEAFTNTELIASELYGKYSLPAATQNYQTNIINMTAGLKSIHSTS